MRLILASASPRRAALLGTAGYVFDVAPADVDESPQAGEKPEAYVLRVAAEKARAVLGSFRGCAVLAADTTVVVDGDMLGKPTSDEDAARMLARLSGRSHQVMTGAVVAAAGRQSGTVVSTTVRFVPMSPADIAWYVATGEPADKAGAYAVQGLGGRFVESVEGSYSNVVGLPLDEVGRLLEDLGVERPGGPGVFRPGGDPAN
jgi:septum formation protein